MTDTTYGRVYVALMSAFFLAVTFSASLAAENSRTISLVDYGAKPDSGEDATEAVRQAIIACREQQASCLVLEPGRYDFWPDFADERYCFVSNNDQGFKRVAFLLDGLNGIEIDGQGSIFVFHGFINPFIVSDSSDIVIRGVTIDYERTFHSEATILADPPEGLDVEFSEAFPYRIDNGVLAFTDGGSADRVTTTTSRDVSYPYGSLLEYDSTLRETAYMARDYWTPNGLAAKQLDNGAVRILLPELDAKPGNVLVFGPKRRDVPAIVISDSDNVLIEDVTILHCGGMGIIAQRSGSIRLNDVRVTPKEGRMISATADATHFVNCTDRIEISDCLFENQKDDPCTIHGVYARVAKRPGTHAAIVQLVHPQQFGFRLLEPGGTIEIVDGPSMRTLARATVDKVHSLNQEFTRFTTSHPLPDSCRPGTVIAAVRDYPAVHIHHCRMRNNRARGILVNSRGKTLIEDNYFHTPGSAILFEGDATFWFEQAGVRDCVIRGNTFDRCNYGVWGKAVIEVGAGIKEAERADNDYNQNIVIEDNLFRMYDRGCAVFAYCVDGLDIHDNRVEYLDSYPPRRENPDLFEITDSTNVSIGENAVDLR